MRQVIAIFLFVAMILGRHPWIKTEPDPWESSAAEEESSAPVILPPSPPKRLEKENISPEWYVNVQAFGAVGDARYHHPLGVRGGTRDPSQYTGWYWAGHFSSLTTAVYQELYQGDDGGKYVELYQVVSDQAELSANQIPISSVNPGPGYHPAVGDWVVQYEAADRENSVDATDDSAAFEEAIRQGKGYLYLPEGDYLISQLTAAKIQGISGPGRIWLKEWRGGILWYLIEGWSQLVDFQNYGWIDADHFYNETWRSMHWITDRPQVKGWTSSANFQGDKDSPCVEYRFEETRDSINVWLTIEPTVPKEEFPEEITICIANVAAYYTLEGQTAWNPATWGGIEGGMFHSSWSGKSWGLPESYWVDTGGWTEITIPREYFFQHLEGSPANQDLWYFHCWSVSNASLLGRPVEFTKSCARVWVKDPSMDNYLLCAVGGDLYSPYGDRPTREYFIHEAYRGADYCLTSQPRDFCAYSVEDDRFDQYFATDGE